MDFEVVETVMDDVVMMDDDVAAEVVVADGDVTADEDDVEAEVDEAFVEALVVGTTDVVVEV